jgi:hypothetical protein
MSAFNFLSIDCKFVYFLILYDQKENAKLILLFFPPLLFIGEDLDIEYISKEVYICAYLSIDKTDD